ncbi:calcium-binding protein CBP-like [Apium graveolens]|uniref:calcium-binding protein CBP-like n=1 Tax=Apium graveolens TaxID=4045 RepID=UPI003D7908AF
MSSYFMFWSDLYSDHHLDGTVTFRSSPLSSFALGEIFEKNDGDISGKIDASELREALVSLGFVVSPLDLLVSKFDKTGGRNKAIEYDNFIECYLTVKGLTEKFKEKDTAYMSSFCTFRATNF